MPKTKALKPIPEQKDKKKNKKENKIDYNIYGVRKEEEFIKLDRPLPKFYETMVEKNGACLVLSAAPGSGKTSYLQNLIGRESYFKDMFDGGIYIISPTIYNDIGATVFREMADFTSDEYSEELAEGIYKNIMEGDRDERQLSFICMDDCIGQFKQRTFAGKMASTCRHMKTILSFSTQQIKSLPPIIRANISHMVIFYQPSNKELAHLVEINSGMGGEQNFLRCYQEACMVKYGMLLLDYRDMKIYKHTPETGEPVEIWSRYNDDGTLNVEEKKVDKNEIKTSVQLLTEEK